MLNFDDSDDEVFFGPTSLKEVRRYINTTTQRQTLCTTYTKTVSEDQNRSVKIIETHSTPNIMSVCSSNAETSHMKWSSDPYFADSVKAAHDNQEPDNSSNTMFVISSNELASYIEPLSYQNVTSDSQLSNIGAQKPDDSVLQIENLVQNLSVIPDKMNDKSNDELDNTLDVIECILNNGPNNDSDIQQVDTKLNIEKLPDFKSKHTVETNMLKPQSAFKTPIKTDRSVFKLKTSERKLRIPNTKTSAFATPGNHLLQKKMLTPHKKQFEHIVSPVASYINDSPMVPLVKNVRPKKPLNGASFIPQLITKSSKTHECNKENQNLPSTAYRCAKQTKVIDLPDEHKLPQSQWAKHVASSLQKGVVMRHIQRKNSTTKKTLFQQQDDSFSNLTLHQADISVCTQKSAVKKPL